MNAELVVYAELQGITEGGELMLFHNRTNKERCTH